jgi:predicted nucleic acid-binding protein
MRVFFDASVIIAALLSPTGGSAPLFKFIKTRTITVVVSQTVVEEVLEEDKPKRIKRSAEQIEQFIAESGLIVREAITEEEIAPYHDLGFLLSA